MTAFKTALKLRIAIVALLSFQALVLFESSNKRKEARTFVRKN